MEKKLTIEHLLPYAAYRLTGLWVNGGNKIYEITNICVCGDGNISFGHSLKTRYKHETHRPLDEFKPLLLPLSELTEEELKEIIGWLFRDSEMIRPNYNKIECNKGFITIFDENTQHTYTVVKPGRDNLPVLNMSNHFSDYQVFFKLHIDLFDLTPQNLAIDKRTIK